MFKFRPQKHEDIERVIADPFKQCISREVPSINKQHPSAANIQNYEGTVLESPQYPRGLVTEGSKLKYDSSHYMLQYIKFPIKLYNPVLGGIEGPVWRALLQAKEILNREKGLQTRAWTVDSFKKICSGELVYSTQNNDWIDIESIKSKEWVSKEDYLFGGEALLAALDDMDFKMMLLAVTLSSVKSAVGKNYSEEIESYGYLKLIDETEFYDYTYYGTPQDVVVCNPFVIFKFEVVDDTTIPLISTLRNKLEFMNVEIARQSEEKLKSYKAEDSEDSDDFEFYDDEADEEDADFNSELEEIQNQSILMEAAIDADKDSLEELEDDQDDEDEEDDEDDTIGNSEASGSDTESSNTMYESNKLSKYDIIYLLHAFVASSDTTDPLYSEENDPKKILASEIVDYAFVLPMAFRPTSKYGVHPLTAKYNRLVQCADTYDRISPGSGTLIGRVQSFYKELYNAYASILVAHEDALSRNKADRFPGIVRELGSKKGLFRQYFLAGRSDYSGRCVITSDWKLQVNQIGIPYSVLAKVALPLLAAYRKYLDTKRKNNLNNKTDLTSNEEWFLDHCPDSYIRLHILYNQDRPRFKKLIDNWLSSKTRYAVIGRQPSLHNLSFQGGEIVAVDDHTIHIHPLVVEPLNADFDGDQMHCSIPVTERGIADVKNNMLFINNAHWAKNGEDAIKLRLEFKYGFILCDKATSVLYPSKSYSLSQFDGKAQKVYEAICDYTCNVHDIIDCNGHKIRAGHIAQAYAIYGPALRVNPANPEEVFHAYSIDDAMSSEGFYDAEGKVKPSYIEKISRITSLAFRVARKWPTTLDMTIQDVTRAQIEEKLDKFQHESIELQEDLKYGLISKAQKVLAFNKAYSAFSNEIDTILANGITDDNGLKKLMGKTKADNIRGNADNMRQVYGIKGQVQQTESKNFDTIVSNNYANQLNSLECMVTAYGSRKGIADKVLATAKPGYLSRRLEHAGAPLCITGEDCGTKEGLHISLEDTVRFIDSSAISPLGVTTADPNDVSFYKDLSTENQFKNAVQYVTSMIQDRWVYDKDSETSVYVENAEIAEGLIKKAWKYEPATKRYDAKAALILRSPVGCLNPVCAKCYGKDLAKNLKMPRRGRHVGLLAGQAIGEPGTQMTMKNFQKGGVSTEKDLTSSFDILNMLFEWQDIKSRRTSQGGVIYDPISTVSGDVTTVLRGNVKYVRVEPDDKNQHSNIKNVPIDKDTPLKSRVNAGESILETPGLLRPSECQAILGPDRTIAYMVMKAYDLMKEKDVHSIHFECIFSESIRYVIKSDVVLPEGDPAAGLPPKFTFRAGSYLSRADYCKYANGTPHYETFLGLKALAQYRTDMFEGLILENALSNIPRGLLFNPVDRLQNPLVKLAINKL